MHNGGDCSDDCDAAVNDAGDNDNIERLHRYGCETDAHDDDSSNNDDDYADYRDDDDDDC